MFEGTPHERNRDFGQKIKVDSLKETNLNKAQQDLFHL